MVTRKLDKDALAKEPYLLWNSFVDAIATGDYAEMTEVQKVAHLAFWYDAEVQNGGHYQYFRNSAGQRSYEATKALTLLALESQVSVLQRAMQLWESRLRNPGTSSRDIIDEAMEGEFDVLDSAYHKCFPTIMQALERYLLEHQDAFVTVEP